jgi:hypothetical protein
MRQKQNRHIAKLIFITLMAFALSGGCFFVGMNWSTWFPSVAEGSVNPDPKVQDPNTDGGNQKAIADTNKYTDFTYKGEVYRVEKSLLTEAGSQYSASNRYYRFVNNKWEVREAGPNSNWKPAKLVDIPIVLAGWNKKFKAKEATPPKATPPPLSPPRADFDQIRDAVKQGKCDANCIYSQKYLTAIQKKQLIALLHP